MRLSQRRRRGKGRPDSSVPYVGVRAGAQVSSACGAHLPRSFDLPPISFQTAPGTLRFPCVQQEAVAHREAPSPETIFPDLKRRSGSESKRQHGSSLRGWTASGEQRWGKPGARRSGGAIARSPREAEERGGATGHCRWGAARSAAHKRGGATTTNRAEAEAGGFRSGAGRSRWFHRQWPGPAR